MPPHARDREDVLAPEVGRVDRARPSRLAQAEPVALTQRAAEDDAAPAERVDAARVPARYVAAVLGKLGARAPHVEEAERPAPLGEVRRVAGEDGARRRRRGFAEVGVARGELRAQLFAGRPARRPGRAEDAVEQRRAPHCGGGGGSTRATERRPRSTAEHFGRAPPLTETSSEPSSPVSGVVLACVRPDGAPNGVKMG